jgi:hypothetical protein
MGPEVVRKDRQKVRKDRQKVRILVQIENKLREQHKL